MVSVHSISVDESACSPVVFFCEAHDALTWAQALAVGDVVGVVVGVAVVVVAGAMQAQALDRRAGWSAFWFFLQASAAYEGTATPVGEGTAV